MRVLVAFDKFKDCMTAEQACATAAEALRGADASIEIRAAPLSDGGEGFCEILTAARNGRIEICNVTGPRFERRMAKLGFVEIATLDKNLREFMGITEAAGKLAVVEMAQASGLWGLAEELRNPWEASSFGTGELLAKAANAGASAILLGIGGSATNDLGLGALSGLGLHALDASGGGIENIRPSQWMHLAGFGGNLLKLPPVAIASDVNNQLLGANGAASVFGPQKGLAKADIERMDTGASRAATLLERHFKRHKSLVNEPSSGAAGGMGFGLACAYGAQRVSGFELWWRWMDMEDKLDWADVVVTGEGRFDASSLSGKGTGAIAKHALKAGKKVILLAGSMDERAARSIGDDGGTISVHAITPEDLPLQEALERGHEFLQNAVERTILTL